MPCAVLLLHDTAFSPHIENCRESSRHGRAPNPPAGLRPPEGGASETAGGRRRALLWVRLDA